MPIMLCIISLPVPYFLTSQKQGIFHLHYNFNFQSCHQSISEVLSSFDNALAPPFSSLKKQPIALKVKVKFVEFF